MVPLVLVTMAAATVNVMMNVVWSRMTPAHMLGRVDAVLGLASIGLMPLGPVIGGGLASALGGAGALILLGVLFLVTAAGAAASRELRRFTGET